MGFSGGKLEGSGRVCHRHKKFLEQNSPRHVQVAARLNIPAILLVGDPNPMGVLYLSESYYKTN